MSIEPSVDPSSSLREDANAQPWVGPEDLGSFNADESLGVPGAFPFTRGPHRAMYRERLWTMRQFAGMGSAEDTNNRFKYLLEHGQTGLRLAYTGYSLR